jgi:tellurium resistance protein TerD
MDESELDKDLGKFLEDEKPMSDLESSDDLGKFLEDDDNIKPIDIGTGAPSSPAQPPSKTDDAKEQTSPEGGDAESAPGQEQAPEPNLPPEEDKPFLPPDASDQPPEEDKPFLPPDAPGNKPDAAEPEQFLKDAIPDEPKSPELEVLLDENRNFANVGDFVDLKGFKPQLNFLHIGGGWDVRSLEGEPPDFDLSLFLLDKEDMTRVDEDFIFYNNPNVLDGAIKHMGDSRTGAGEGDDEVIKIDLNGIPFDVMKIVFVLSVYDQDGKGHHMQMMKNAFIRVVDGDDRLEVVCYKMPDDSLTTATAIKVAALVREGPQWFFEPMSEPVVGGLARAATEYGIIVQELQSSGDDF